MDRTRAAARRRGPADGADGELRAAFARAATAEWVRERAAAPAAVRIRRRAACLLRGHRWTPIGHDAAGVTYGCLRCGALGQP